MLTEWALKWRIPLAALQDLVATVSILSEPGTTGSETDVQARVRLAASKRGIRLWRNNSGVAQDEKGRVVRFGLCNDSARMNETIKSSDLIGISPTGQFIAREVKAPGWKYSGTKREQAQLKFITLINSMGGDAKFVSSDAWI